MRTLNEQSACYKYALNMLSFRVWVSHPTVILSVVEGSSVAKNHTIAPDKFL